MGTQNYDSSVSGYIMDGWEGISRDFTQVEVLLCSGHNILAKAKRYGRWWMLKALQPEKRKQQIYEQMVRKELEILMSMQSPYIVQTAGIEPVEGLGMCIVMEYIDGVRLDEWLKLKQSKEKRFRLAEELLKATDYIHSIGVVHRDLKPGNIMVTRNGEHLKLIDFGLADNDHIAILKQPAGTPKYTSPEQATENTPDIRNDIYSLGVILKQLLPERRYQSAIDKCFLPLTARYHNVNLLLGKLQNRNRRKQKTIIGMLIILIAALFTGLGIQTVKLEQRENRRVNVNEAIEEGRRRADRVFEAVAMEEMMDTCTSYTSIITYYNEHCQDADNCTQIYIDSIWSSFTKSEMYEITNAIKTHCEERRQAWFEKLLEINKLQNEKLIQINITEQ